MSHQSYREESRKNWGKDTSRGGLTDADVKLGALLRIADATEAMAKRHKELIDERDRFEQYYRREQSVRIAWERRAAALKGQITKLKKRLAIAQTQAFGGDPAECAFKKVSDGGTAQ
jgi:hypothetical protein